MNPANQLAFKNAAKFISDNLFPDSAKISRGELEFLNVTNVAHAANHTYRLLCRGKMAPELARQQEILLCLADDGSWGASVNTFDARGVAYTFDSLSSSGGWGSAETAFVAGARLAAEQLKAREKKVAAERYAKENRLGKGQGQQQSQATHAAIVGVSLLCKGESTVGHGLREAVVRISARGTARELGIVLDKSGSHIGFTVHGEKAMQQVVKELGWSSIPQLLARVNDAAKAEVAKERDAQSFAKAADRKDFQQ